VKLSANTRKKEGPQRGPFQSALAPQACGGGALVPFPDGGGAVFGVVVPGVGEVGFEAGGVVPGVVVLPGVAAPGVVDSGLLGAVSGVVFGAVCGVGVVVVFGVVPGVAPVVPFGFEFVGAGVGATVPEGGETVPGCACPAGAVWPVVPWPDMDPEVCAFPPLGDPSAVPVVPADPPVCSAAIITALSGRREAVGPGLVPLGVLVEPLVHWSATLVALLTLNCRMPAEFVPEVALALPPEAVALEFEPEAVEVAFWSGVDALDELMPELPLMPCSCPVT
jgi:hypothetical protein